MARKQLCLVTGLGFAEVGQDLRVLRELFRKHLRPGEGLEFAY